MLIAAPVWDCKPEDKDDSINWVELKTSADITDDKDWLKYERKLLKFWVQSFLLGVPKIVVGFRTKHGILQRLEELETQDIPGIIKRKGKGTWDGNLCINFTASFLECRSFSAWVFASANALLGLKETIHSNGVWRIRRKERSPVIEVYKSEKSGYGDILSPEFVGWRNGHEANEAGVEAAKARLIDPIN